MKLTLPQQDVYFEQLLYPNEPIYNIGAKIKIDGKIEVSKLKEAYVSLINQHDVYRGSIAENGAHIAFLVSDEHSSALPLIDFSDQKDPEAKAEDFMRQEFAKPFSFQENTFLHKFLLLKIHEEKYYLFSVYHHIITDGWGTSLMFQRLVSNYNELVAHDKILTAYPYAYAAFAEDDAQYFLSDSYEKDKQYWKERFQTLPPPLFEAPSETVHTNKSDRKRLVIKRETYNQLIKIATEHKSSAFHVILGVLFLYLGRKHEQEDLSIGIPVLNRGKATFKKTVGLFMGVSALRVQMDFQCTFIELLHEIRQQLLQDYRHQRFPLGKLIKELQLYDKKNSLFNLTLSYEKQDYACHFANTKTQVIPLSHGAERVALAVYVREFDQVEDVVLDFDYNLHYFNESLISSFVAHVEQLLNQIILEPRRKLAEYEYLAEDEKRQLIYGFNQTDHHFSESETVLEYIKRQVEKTPDAIAVLDKNESYTYQQLEDLSNRAALQIAERNPSKKPVAILMPRSARLIIGILAIMKSGSAYIPLDPKFPVKRLKYIIDHSNVALIVAADSYADFLDKEAIALDGLLEDKSGRQMPVTLPTGNDTAYIIYTSGSTGNPKGVEIKHSALLNFLLSMQKSPGVSSNDLLLSVTTQSFDISILEFFAPLVCGGTTYIATNDILEDPFAMIQTIKIVQPTIIQATPSFYQMLLNAGWQGDKSLKILCGGDLLSRALADTLLDNSAAVWNMYGPTETTIWSSCKRLEDPSQFSTIGKPIQNTQIYILNTDRSLVPVGTPGNLYIAGKGLAKGYYRNTELTLARFVENPFAKEELMYDTGDIGKWNEQGEIIFLGRNDNQVKIRGFRIELGDIETKINAIKNIQSSVVVAKKQSNGESFLAAYVIKEGERLDIQKVFETLQEELPTYMVPSKIIEIDTFPLTANKKIDRKALAQQSLSEEWVQNGASESPTTDLELQLSKIYEEVLELERNIGLNENFFELGGHSLNAVRLINKIEKKFNNRLSLKTIFQKPTPKEIANHLIENTAAIHRNIPIVEKQPYYPITAAQYTLWLASLIPEKSIAYNMFATYAVEGELDLNALRQAFIEVLQRFEILRTNFIEIDGAPYQKIHDFEDISFSIEVFETSQASSKEQIRAYANSEFNLEKDLLLKVGFFKDECANQTLLFVTHHLIMDGWSLEVLIKEIAERYKKTLGETNYQDEQLTFQFKDFTAWQNAIEQHNAPRNNKFWSTYLENYPWNNLIPYDKKIENIEYSGAFYLFDWDLNLLKSLNAFVVEHQVSLHSLLVATFNALLHKLHGHKDICIGTINSGRVFSELNDHIGMFVKTLPLRTKIDDGVSFLKLLKDSHENVLCIDEHQDIPQLIMNTLRLEAILVLQNPTYDYDNIYISETLAYHSYPIDSKYNRLPLLIDFSINENFFHGSIHYDTEKYDLETVEYWVLKLHALIKEVVSNPGIAIKAIDATLDFEKKNTVNLDFNF